MSAHSSREGIDPDEGLAEERAAFAVDAPHFSLLRAFALLGRIEEPQLPPEESEAAVRALGHRVRTLLGARAGFAEQVASLVEVLFVEAGFRGDEEDYDNPHNSFLHVLLRRRRGLPIALSVLTLEVAREAGIDAFGIAFPGHFLVGLPRAAPIDPTDFVVIDPFHSGVLLSAADLHARARAYGLHAPELQPEWLGAASPASILLRMLTNLRRSYAQRAAHASLLQTLTRMLWLRPREGDRFLERAELRRILLDERGAIADAQRALSLARDEPLRTRAERLIARIEEERAWVQ